MQKQCSVASLIQIDPPPNQTSFAARDKIISGSDMKINGGGARKGATSSRGEGNDAIQRGFEV